MTADLDFSQGSAFVRGEYLPIAQAAIPITDWGFLRSDATYDVVTVWDGAFFRLQDHLARFERSCASFRLDAGLSAEHIVSILTKCVRLAGLRNAYVEMICTRGQPPWGSRDPNLVVSDVQRIPATSVDPRAKNYHWNDLTMGLLGALDAGGDSVVLTDAEGNVVEGPGFNIFCLNSEGVLVTPAAGVLEGITRRTVLEMAHAAGMRVEQRALPVQELRGAREVFVSSSAGGVLPVTRVDSVPVGGGAVGPVTKQLVQTYWDWHGDPRYSLAVDYAV